MPSHVERDLSPADRYADAANFVQLKEQLANLVSIRRSLSVGLALWVGFGVADIAMDAFGHPGSLKYTLGIRFGALPIHAVLLGRMYLQPAPSPRVLRFCELSMFTIAIAGISLMMIPLGGLSSIYFGGVMLVVGARGAFAAERWQEGIVPNTLMVAAHVLALLWGVTALPSFRPQLADGGALVSFGVQLGLILSTAGFGVIAGNTAWTLRRQVFEARSIGKYRLVRAIGQGGMGEVWRAYHPGLKRDVAVKLLRPDRDPSLQQRFEREVQSTIQLSHPNTIRVFDYGITEDGISYYVMELLEGCTVRDLVVREGPLDARRVLYLAIQAAGALAEAHDCGIVHRDVKPENIFVTTVGRTGDFAKILDFGIAKAINSQEGDGLTRTGIRMGTPGYIAPEILLGHEAAASADVYALGAVLHFMLIGAPPLQSEKERSLQNARSENPHAPVSTWRSDSVPASLDAVVQRCLCPEPSARFTDAAAVLAALHACDDVGTWHPAPLRLAEPIEGAPRRGNTMPAHTATVPTASPQKRVVSRGT